MGRNYRTWSGRSSTYRLRYEQADPQKHTLPWHVLSPYVQHRPDHRGTPASIGSFLVGRLLPFRDKRLVGPFCFIDHMGRQTSPTGEDFDVAPHPHIGLSTLTYLFEGRILHRDSLGTTVEIKPGAVNWMTAGKGIVHSERTPEHLRGKPNACTACRSGWHCPRNARIWTLSSTIRRRKNCPHGPMAPCVTGSIAGEAFGKRSPVPVYSKLFFLELTSAERAEVDLGTALFGEAGLYILQGGIISDGNHFGPKQILVSTQPSLCTFTLEPGTSVLSLRRRTLPGGTLHPLELCGHQQGPHRSGASTLDGPGVPEDRRGDGIRAAPHHALNLLGFTLPS
jgi:redox-sensitive bicupin YhaK (pirin superfamily)